MSKTLLVTDDAVIIREIIKDTVRQNGWEIAAEAANGREAVEHYRRARPTAVTLDLVMPEFDGLYALRHILEEDPEARVLVVSALDQKSVLKEAFRLGAADFIVKPFDRQLLIDSLEQIIAGAPVGA